MLSLVQYIQESMNIDKYYNEYGERKGHNYDLAKLKKGDTIYFFKDNKGNELLELKVSKVDVVQNPDEKEWWRHKYICKVYVEKNEEDIEYLFDYHSKSEGPFTGWYVTSIFILSVAVMYEDKRTGNFDGLTLHKIALDKDDILDHNEEYTQEVKDELKKRKAGWPERYINKTLEEFKKHESKDPDKTYNTTVGMLVKFLRQNHTPLDDWGCINDLVKYCFDDNMRDFKKYLKIIEKQEIEIKQYNLGDDTPEAELLTYLGDYPIIIDEADEDDDYTGMVSLETFLRKKSKKK